MPRTAFSADTGVERLRGFALVALVLLPLLIGGILSWGLSTPTQNLDRVTAAVVNDDTPVTVNGTTVPLGRQFAAGLIAGTTNADAQQAPPNNFSWILTNDDEAKSGLASGRYAAVVTIPSDFSAKATSISGPAADATQALLKVETSAAASFIDPALTAAVTQVATASLNRQLTTQYLGNIYSGFNSINQQIGQAATGAASVASGAASVSAGAASLASGTAALSSGASSLDAGAASLAAGLDSLSTQSQGLPAQTAQLAAGATGVATATSDASTALSGATASIQAVVAQVCQSPGALCRAASAALARVQSASGTVSTLSGVAGQVAAGNQQLAAAMPQLVGRNRPVRGGRRPGRGRRRAGGQRRGVGELGRRKRGRRGGPGGQRCGPARAGSQPGGAEDSHLQRQRHHDTLGGRRTAGADRPACSDARRTIGTPVRRVRPLGGWDRTRPRAQGRA